MEVRPAAVLGVFYIVIAFRTRFSFGAQIRHDLISMWRLESLVWSLQTTWRLDIIVKIIGGTDK